ncbi:kinase-like domain-containing protein [Stachybotrys elegans]|uniref:Kinase-like domain-containing protein n=1 Tax=Stachybotrys elegans TaxID=80388 RepID=A0A8K0WQ23_9HYPO|nr:kinase-like domain-containing protein [Stachybotrys elegans]
MFVQESIAIHRVPPPGSNDAYSPPRLSVGNYSDAMAQSDGHGLSVQDAVEYSDDSRRITKRSKISMQYEVELVNWIRCNTTIPVPAVTSHFYDESRQQFVAVFETRPGRPLADCWGDMSTSQKTSIISELAFFLGQLRTITTSQIPNTFTRDRFLDPRDGLVRGPFHTTQEFLGAIGSRIDRIGSLYDPGQTKKALRFLDALQASPARESLVFTHGNFCPENILVDDSGRVVAILDWSECGYAPLYWEYIKSHIDDDDSDFYLENVLDHIMEPWPIPLSIMMHVHRIIW